MNQKIEPSRSANSPPRLPPVSVVILTLNEEENITECLRSCMWSDDVHVLDSGSSDRTREIAESMGAKVYVNPFKSFGQQRNWAIDSIPCKYKWHFHLDADERFTPPLIEEMCRELGSDGSGSDIGCYLVPNKMIFMGRWIRHAGGFPAYQVRLIHCDRARFTDFGHGQREVCSMGVGRLQSSYLHYNFSKGLNDWLHKHNGYSDLEAAEGVVIRHQRRPRLRELRTHDPTLKRRAIKNFSYFIGARALLRFLYLYVLRGGLFDGLPGFHYCAMISMYEYWIDLKIREQESPWKQRTTEMARSLLGDDVEPANNHPLVDILIPTLNEADHITEAVTNARKLGTVYVLDSLSTDGTQELARAAGAKVYEHKFETYSAQKNWALDNLPFTADWIFILDADERITPALRREVERALARDPDIDGYYINRVLLFMGREVRHGGLYPSWNLRLFRRGRARYEERAVHEHMVCAGRTDYLKHEMLHIRRESMSQYILKHIRYADMESDEWVKLRLGESRVAPAEQLFRHHLRYRQWLRRHVWPLVPWRPFWRFLHMYLLRLGFLDGRAGWHLARLMMTYEYMISLMYRDKLITAREARRAKRSSAKISAAKVARPSSVPIATAEHAQRARAT